MQLATANPIRYRGYYFDVDTGLYYLNARYYSPQFRRFISPDDTAYLDVDTVGGLDLYTYCGNDPVNNFDPSGHSVLDILAALLCTAIGGIAFQTAVSVLSYVGIAIASVFDEDIRKDMNRIGWNPFNDDASSVLNANKVSFYKGAPVFHNYDSLGCFSFGFIVFDKNNYGKEPDILMHERGHNTQMMLMGPLNYGLLICIPSPLKNGSTTTWELSASMLDGSNRGTVSATNQQKHDAMLHLICAMSNNPFLWLINLHLIFSTP